MKAVLTSLPIASQNGHASTQLPVANAPAASAPPRPSRGRLASGLCHLETGFLIAIPLSPIIATFITVLLYVAPASPPESTVWNTLTHSMPPIAYFPVIVVLVWVALAIPMSLLRLGCAERVNSSSHSHITARLLSMEPYRHFAVPLVGGGADATLAPQLDLAWRTLNSGGSKWVLGDGFIAIWRLVDQMDASLNYLLPRDWVGTRAQALQMWLPNPTKPRSGEPDPRAELRTAISVLSRQKAPDAWLERRERGAVAKIQKLIDSSKTDRYAGFVRARNLLLAACTVTAIALYCLFWLGIVALPSTFAQSILSSALFFTTVGALVGLFQLLYAESQSDKGVDDYGLSIARLVVSPQIAALAALVGVVLTSLTTSVLSGSPSVPTPRPTTIAEALDQISNPANVLVAVTFALSPALVFRRFRQDIEQSKRDLSKSTSAAIVQTKAG